MAKKPQVERIEVVDLKPAIRALKSDGKHLLHKDEHGDAIYAIIRGGGVVRYEVRDSNDKLVPLTHSRFSTRDRTSETEKEIIRC